MRRAARSIDNYLYAFIFLAFGIIKQSIWRTMGCHHFTFKGNIKVSKQLRRCTHGRPIRLRAHDNANFWLTSRGGNGTVLLNSSVLCSRVHSSGGGAHALISSKRPSYKSFAAFVKPSLPFNVKADQIAVFYVAVLSINNGP